MESKPFVFFTSMHFGAFASAKIPTNMLSYFC